MTELIVPNCEANADAATNHFHTFDTHRAESGNEQLVVCRTNPVCPVSAFCSHSGKDVLWPFSLGKTVEYFS